MNPALDTPFLYGENHVSLNRYCTYFTFFLRCISLSGNLPCFFSIHEVSKLLRLRPTRIKYQINRKCVDFLLIELPNKLLPYAYTLFTHCCANVCDVGPTMCEHWTESPRLNSIIFCKFTILKILGFVLFPSGRVGPIKEWSGKINPPLCLKSDWPPADKGDVQMRTNRCQIRPPIGQSASMAAA